MYLSVWVEGYPAGLTYHTRKMLMAKRVVSQEFIRRNIISSPEIEQLALTAPKS